MLRTIALCALLLPGLAAPSMSVPGAMPAAAAIDETDDALAAALAEFRKQAGKDDLALRRAALDAVVALGHEDALEPLLERFTRARKVAAEAAQDLVDNRILVERRRVQLAELELAAERKKGLKPKIAELSKEIEDLERKLARDEERLSIEEPWRDALRDGARGVLDAQGDSKRRKLLKELWKTLEKGDAEDERIAAAELLAQVAVPTTTTRIAKAMAESYDHGIDLQKGLPELEADVNEWGRKAQEENVRLGGQLTQATGQAYEAARRKAAELRRRITTARTFGDELRSAAALALAKEAPADRAEDVPDLFKLARRSVHSLAFLDLLAESATPEAAAAMADELLDADEPLARGRLVDHLAALVAADVEVGRDLEAWLLADGLAAESWHLRSRVVAALATIRSAAAIPVLIERLEGETGRLRSDIGAALVALTGQDFHGNVVLWQRWWADHGEGFVVPDEPPPSSEEKALAEVGLTFFGLSTESQRVLFVLDVSGSMEFPMKSTSGTGRGRSTEGDRRIDIARRQLLKALGGIDDGGTFNIVCYASDVWTWSDEPVTMDAETRAEATEFVEGIQAVGGTNIYGAMQTGLRQARGKKKKKGAPRWIEPAYDTIFLLSDGVPSMGVSTDRHGILNMVAEENADLGIVIHTIGLSTDQDAVLMRSLAEQNGGTYAAR